MSIERHCQRTGRALLGVLGGLLLAGFAGLAWTFYQNRDRHSADGALAAELRDASLALGEERSVPVGEWPQWRGPNRDGVSRETGLFAHWPEEGPKQLWRVRAGGGYSSLAVSHGRVYTLLQDGDNETVACWDAANGNEIWRFGYPCKYTNEFGSGPRSTPAVDEDRVYSVGATGLLYCLDARTGREIWRHDLLKEFAASNPRWGVACSPLVEGDLVFVSPGGAEGNSLAAFHKADGKLAWKALDDPASYSSPITITVGGARQIVFFTGSGLVGVAPTSGKPLWRFPWETGFYCNIATPLALVETAGGSSTTYLFISSGYGKGCSLIKLEVESNGTIQPKPVYENNRMCNHFSSSVFYQDYLYGFSDPGVLKCMEARTGEVQWARRGFGKGSLTVADGRLILLGERGTLALASASPTGYREEASFKLPERLYWTAPVLANGRLYVRDEQELACYELGRPASGGTQH